MDAINNQIIELKRRFQQKQIVQNDLKKKSLAIVEALLGQTAERYLTELYFKSGKLFLESRNKSAANELLFIRNQLCERVKIELGIKAVVIR